MKRCELGFPQHRSARNWLDGCLRIVIAVQCFGLAGRYLFSPNERESDVFEWLQFDFHWPEPLVQSIDNAGAWLTLAAGLLLCVAGIVRPRMDPESMLGRSLRWLDGTAALWIAVWVFTMAVAHRMRATLYADLTFAEDAVRYVAPLALLLLINRPTRRLEIERGGFQAERAAVILLMLAAAATFAAHGYKAIECYGPFMDLVLLSDMRWTQFYPSESTVQRSLVAIGVVDLLVAILLVVARWPAVAFYMAVWGGVAAASRMTAFGFSAWPETLLRAANGGVPLAILGYWIVSRRQRSVQPETTASPDTSTPHQCETP
ncbi:hypothetical protein [Allorhodopirellula solitaria]|uniref:Uncharacterized protein n=1 Tax=Allorhodopirellula solitaria TaxID=2527987 RepID=A0A5C5YIN6_9BACT|nr:hypothetical protein [Allorhodopirellula solitaria]TWT74734.1 hypothetical protein CA85_00190 [Allorhodopirellula solitaria]